MGKKTPEIAPSHRSFITLLDENRATAIGNMHKNGKDRACGSGDMLADRQTDTQTSSLQYFATAPEGEVINFQYAESGLAVSYAR